MFILMLYAFEVYLYIPILFTLDSSDLVY